MKREAGWAAALLVAAAGTVGVHARQNGDADLQGGDPVHSDAKAQIAGPCSDLTDRLTSFLQVDRVVAPPQEDGDLFEGCPGAGAVPVRKTQAAYLHVVLATLPDPLHTHMSLSFDRSTASLQQAAADAGFVYDSSWMPWQTEKSEYKELKDSDAAAERTNLREDQPGILLFRDSPERAGKIAERLRWLNAQRPKASGEEAAVLDAAIKRLTAEQTAEKAVPDRFRSGLIILVVGEEPTAGIHRTQFRNAVAWIQALRMQGLLAQEQPALLAPSFSGSLPALAELLNPPLLEALRSTPKDPKTPEPLRIYSGQVSSKPDLDDFGGRMRGKGAEIFSFEQEDGEVLRRYCSLLQEPKTPPSLALISEDETAYGAAREPQRCGTGEIQRFFYPRDISALRSAYQKQGIFSPAAGQTVHGEAAAPHRYLQSDVADQMQDEHDTVRAYGGAQSALSEEAVLMQLVSQLKAHHPEFLVLQSSNPLDQLFLAHFFKESYPEGRVVILGNDLLLRREVGRGGLTGILTLDTYPLLPEIDHWTAPEDQPGSHRIFAENDAEGDYFALRFLLEPDRLRAGAAPAFLPANAGEPMSGYGTPEWLPAEQRPATWLSVLDLHGFWPVASMGEQPDKSEHPLWLDSISAIAHQLTGGRPTGADPWQEKVAPFSTKLALLAMFLWAGFHLYGCCGPSLTMKPDLRSYFVRPHKSAGVVYRSHLFLIVLSSALLTCVGAVLAGGYGWLSYKGMPLKESFRYALFPLLLWGIGALAVVANACIESTLNQPGFDLRWKDFRKQPRAEAQKLWGFVSVRAALLPLLAYTLITGLFTFGVLGSIDNSLTPEVRTVSYLRAMNLFSGASPSLPLLLLVAGLYLWCWYGLRGLSLFGADRPRLPSNGTLPRLPKGTGDRTLRMLSHQGAAKPIERLCLPIHHKIVGICVALFGGLLLGALALSAHGWVPIRSLVSITYVKWIWLLLAINTALLLGSGLQIYLLWSRLRSLLTALDKLPLRRTLQSIHGFTWGSIWNIGSNAVEARYKVFYRVLESGRHLRRSLRALRINTRPAGVEAEDIDSVLGQLEGAREVWQKFALWRSKNWDRWPVRDLTPLEDLQKTSAALAGRLISDFLLPVWLEEEASLLIPPKGAADTGSDVPIPSCELPACVRNAEEVVCLVYLGFIQNVVARVRSLVIGMIFLFVAIALVLPSYPFDPRPVMTVLVTVLFVVVAGVVFTVYSQMFRDATLSHLTNTRPGELGSEFWRKFLSFGIAPLVGLLATVFPGFSDVISTLLQPGLSMLK